LFSGCDNITKNLNINKSADIEDLEQTCLFGKLKKYDVSVRKQNISKQKICCVDNKLIGQINFGFSKNNGCHLESLVFVDQ